MSTKEQNTTDPTWEGRFQLLLRTWNDHQDLKLAGGEVADLAASRQRLDDARRAMWQAAA